MEDLFKLLPKMLSQFKDSAEFREAVVFAAWRKAAGRDLARNTAPVSLEEKRLVLAVRDETWKKHLESLAGQMIFKVNSLLGQAEVTFIEFRVEKDVFENPPVASAGRKADSERILEEVPTQLRESADAITDDELRYKFLLAAGSCLERKKRLSK